MAHDFSDSHLLLKGIASLAEVSRGLLLELVGEKNPSESNQNLRKDT